MTSPTRWNPPKPAVPRTVLITPRMADILSGICLGHSNAEIGRRLYITKDTVKTITSRLYRRMGARDRAHAAALACSGHLTLIVFATPGEKAAA